MANLCGQLFEIKDAYLHGSYVIGDYDIESDIDIFLTVDMDGIEFSKYRYSVAVIYSDLSLKYNVNVLIADKFLSLD